MDKIIIQTQDFDLSTELKLLTKNAKNIGAAVSFVGFVRDLHKQPLTKITLENYPKMTQKALAEIASKAHKRWVLGDITIIHRIGNLRVNAQIVLVIVSSKHRKSAFEACEFIMDYLKTQAPFWKKEHSQNQSKWVEAKIGDKSQAKRWD
ncbi:MAG: molybdenum cofactor biosynthesis protein MoaE [Candidatus Thioglobus sp.]|nr:molybdenum cofactor biosynthesis protein MoaE [Candidatus Thioglobus sp.]